MESEEAILSACAPPADVQNGRSCIARHRVPGGSDWWEIQFTPLQGEEGLLGIVGVIRLLNPQTSSVFSLPENLMSVRVRQGARYLLDDLGADSPRMLQLRSQAKLAAETHVPLTIVGEPGVGKEWLARAIHARSELAERLFLCLDARRIPSSLISELLFKSRHRGQNIGAVYLKNPNHLPRELQDRLTGGISSQNNPDFPRFMLGVSTYSPSELHSQNLLDTFCLAAGTLTIAMPPLRERLDELPRWVERFLQREEQWGQQPVRGATEEAIDALRSYGWPNNLTELQNVIRSACSRTRGDLIELSDLPFYLKQGPLPVERRLPLDTLLEQVERRLIALALRLTQNNQTRAADLLQIWRPRLMRRMEKFGIGTDS